MPEIEGGYIKLYRKMTKWQWYSDEVMFRVFMHLLLTVNYTPMYWRDIKVDRGQTVISLAKLGATLNYSKDTVLKALKRLEGSGEITRKPTAKYTIITVVNYNQYQDIPTDCRPMTDRLPTADRPLTDRRVDPMEEVKNNKKNKKDEEGEEGGACSALPPETELTESYLVALYGIDATEKYKRKFNRWCQKKNKHGLDCIKTIAKWMEQDGVPVKDEDEFSNSSFDPDYLDELLLSEYSSFDVKNLDKHLFDKYSDDTEEQQ